MSESEFNFQSSSRSTPAVSCSDRSCERQTGSGRHWHPGVEMNAQGLAHALQMLHNATKAGLHKESAKWDDTVFSLLKKTGTSVVDEITADFLRTNGTESDPPSSSFCNADPNDSLSVVVPAAEYDRLRADWGREWYFAANLVPGVRGGVAAEKPRKPLRDIPKPVSRLYLDPDRWIFDGLYQVKHRRSTKKDSTPYNIFGVEKIEDLAFGGGFQIVRGGHEPATPEEWTEFKEMAAELESGQCWLPTDPPEFTWEYDGVRYNQLNERYRQIVYKWHIVNRDYDTKDQLATELGLSQHQVRTEKIMKAMKDCPTTKLSPDLIKRLQETDGRIVLVHVLADRPRWYELDMREHDTYQQALDALRLEGVERAMKDWRKTRVSKNDFNAKLKEVTARWTEWLRRENVYILDLRMPTAIAITEGAEKEAETVKQKKLADATLDAMVMLKDRR